ncbi:MAG: 30S ribosomal protein S6 [Solirubrobacterales bacterium]
MPNSYELVVMLDADAPTDTRTKIVKDAEALLAQHGEVKATKSWGVRQLPYEIDHHGEADYSIFRFESEPTSISTLDRALKLTEGVLRFRIFEAETEGEIPDSPPLFKREERTYERPPREAQADGEFEGETPAPAAEGESAAEPAEEAPAAEAPAEEPTAAEEAPAEEAPAE